MSDALVDVFCSDLEVGRNLVLREVGPSCAYLEHTSPLPVGAELRVHTDSGSELGAVVVRVHEVSFDASRAVGMFVRVIEIGGAAESWWKAHVAIEADPIFPEPPKFLAGATSARIRALEVSSGEMAQAGADGNEGATIEMEADEPPLSPRELAASMADGRPDDVKATVKMTADQIKDITDQAPASEGEDDDDDSNGVSNGRPAGKKKRRRKRK